MKPWLIAAIAFAVATVASWIVTEVLREVVNARRLRQRGVGGTGDIGLWGMIVTAMCTVGMVTCWAFWFATKK